jgi:amino acid adenylation domain-containing protein
MQAGVEASCYNIAHRWRLDGPLDVERLHDALLNCVQRYDALRCVFLEVDGAPMQRVMSEARLPWQFLDLMGSTDAHAAVERCSLEQATRTFDLERDPPLRACLLRLSPGAHVLLLTVHHLVSDGWSSGLIARQIERGYARQTQLADGEIGPSFVEYACQHAGLADQASEDVEYWTNQLAGDLPQLRLQLDAPERDTAEAARSVGFLWGDTLVPSLQDLGRLLGCTPFTAIASALLVLLARIDGQQDVRIGYPIANRSHRAMETVGCFINTAVLRVRVDMDDTVSELTARVSRLLMRARRHRSMTLEQLISLAASQRTARAPLVQVMLNLNPNDTPPLNLAELRVSILERVSVGSPCEQSWIISRRDGPISGRLEYDPRCQSSASASRLADRLAVILGAMAVCPDERVGRLPWLLPEEQGKVLSWASGSSPRFDDFIPVHALVAETSARAPRAPALEIDGRVVDYGSLDELVCALAARLTALGAGRETAVAVCLGRDVAAVVALLAILRVGATYVPIDANQSERRIARVFEDAAVAIVLTDLPRRSRLPQTLGSVVVMLDRGGSVGGLAMGTPTTATVHPLQLAYCLYTSGSSGEPKGVMIPAKALSDHVRNCVARYGLTPADRVLQFAAWSFDTSIEQVLAPLVAGACLVLRGDGVWTAEELADVIRCRSVTVADLPTAYWHQFATLTTDPLADTDLRLLLIGGEAALAGAQNAHKRGFRTFNAYGPTETTVTACIAEVGEAPPGLGPFLSIGRPLAGTRVYVFDERLAPVAPGAIGEICIAGDRLARGYLGRPSATAERFMPDPFGPSGSCLYRTGDLGRYLPDGQIEFLGRADGLVKLHGIRIEVGEVEAALLTHPSVRDAVVVMRDAGTGSALLEAHLVLSVPCTLATLKRHAHECLTEHAVPTAWHFHASLPLTPHGKVDRKRLAATSSPGNESPSREARADVAANPTLCGVLEAARELAPAGDVGPDDDLLQHGFHSMLIVRLASILTERYHVTLGMRDMVRLRTPRELAVHINYLTEGRAAASSISS